MCSEAVSPALYNNFLKSVIVQSPSLSSSCPNIGASLTPKSIKTPPPPPAPIGRQRPARPGSSGVLPSPPSLRQMSQSSPSESFPLPPVFTYQEQVPVKPKINKSEDTRNKQLNQKANSPNFIVKSVISKLNLASKENKDTKTPSSFNGETFSVFIYFFIPAKIERIESHKLI